MRNVFIVLLLTIVLFSCNRSGLYECVCYNRDEPSDYVKYDIKNNHTEAYNNCSLLTDNSRYCQLTK
jgi:hypothetical protein